MKFYLLDTIVGEVMEELSEGAGVIMVLVALQ